MIQFTFHSYTGFYKNITIINNERQTGSHNYLFDPTKHW